MHNIYILLHNFNMDEKTFSWTLESVKTSLKLYLCLSHIMYLSKNKKLRSNNNRWKLTLFSEKCIKLIQSDSKDIITKYYYLK